MKKFTLFLTAFLLTFTMMQAQNFKVLLVDDDNNGSSETATIETALTNSGYTWTKASSSTPTFADMEQYDIVLWYTGNDATTHLWKTDVNENSVYNDDLMQFANNGGIVWVDGLDFFYNIVGTAPDNFPAGTFVNDTLGITDYLSQSHTSDDGNQGVPQYDKATSNSITSINPINWEYSTLWFADGLAISSNAHPLYEMMGGAYPLAGQITALYNQVGTSTYITSGFRIAKMYDQTMKNNLLSQMFTYAEANWDTEANAVTPLGDQAINTGDDGTTLTVTETVGWDSREWKYSTTSGSGYVSFGTPETAKTYTPNFASQGTYYVVCETTYGATVKTSNEIKIVVSNATNTNSINPNANQYIQAGTDGTQLSVTENPTADSREWKYSTTSGSGYQSFAPVQTGTTYTPNFATQGVYYIVCESNFSGTVVTSNEVKVVVDKNTSDYYLAFDGDDSFYVKDVGENFINVTDNWTIETWVKVDSYTAGTYPVIIDREKCFSMYVQSDGAGTDDFSIAFVSRDASDAIVSSLSSVNNINVTFNFDEWYHVAVQYNGTDAKMFINGNEIATTTDNFTLRNAGEYVNIGTRYRSGYQRYFTGSLENIHFSKVARYSSNFTPNFYAQQQADANSIFCLNFENGTGLNLFDASGNFSNIKLRNPNNDSEWKTKKVNAVTPADVQNIVQSTDGDELTVTENGIATSREWKYSTTSGSGYVSFGTPETAKTYTPNFASIGTYYLVCQSVFNGTSINSNEVEINVSEPASITTGTISGSPFTVSSTTAANVDVPYTITGLFDGANIFTAYLSDATGDFTSEVAIGNITSDAAGTITATIPAGTASGTAYRIRVKSDNPAVVGSDNGTDLEVVNLKPSITPTDVQFIQVSQNGTLLTVSEPATADSREWKYSTTSGSGYVSFGTPEAGITYTPNFNANGIYYVVCESTYGADVEISNEVKVVVDFNTSNYYLSFDGNDTFYAKDDNLEILNNATNNYTIETWVKVKEYQAGTYPVIMDRDSTFTLYVQSDNTDDFSIAFVTRDINDGIDGSLSSANLPSVTFNFNKWYHVAVQYDGTEAKMFINGNEVASNNTDDFDLRANNTKYLNIGARYRNNYERYLKGSLENINFTKTVKYSANFTPDFYSQESADANSILCLNFENNGNSELFDASGHFLAITKHGASWKIKAENAVSPSDVQNIIEGADGDELTVYENGLPSNTEWKYSTTSGSGYASFGTPETAKTYTPNFATMGTYYVVCVSNFNGTDVISNEVQINVTEELTITTGTISGSPFTVNATTGASVDVPYTTTGLFDGANIFTAYLSDATGDFTSETVIGTLVSATAGTIVAEIPANTPSGTAYRIRVKSDNPVIVGSDNGVDLVIDLTVGVNNISSNKIVIYPNPASDVLYIKIDKNVSEIKIVDNLGRLVLDKELVNNKVNISNLKSGIYTILVKTKNGLMHSQFIKK